MRSIICVLLAVLLLAGCDTQDAPTSDPPATAIPTDTIQPAPSLPETFAATLPTEAIQPEIPAARDASARLKEVEDQCATLQDTLINDGSLTQADMNDLAGQQYTLWDTLLNDLWAELTHTLPETQMRQLLQEERAWIRWKENSIALAADYYSGGSLSILAADTQAVKLTRDRVYELAEILSSRQYPSPHSDTGLYDQAFLPLISSGQQPTYENLLLLLDFRGLTLQEDEGTIQILDPQQPGSYLFGSLSNESGTLTIPQLGYCLEEASSRRGVRVDFFTAPPDYYIDAVTWDDGTLVSSPEELTAYLQSAG